MFWGQDSQVDTSYTGHLLMWHPTIFDSDLFYAQMLPLTNMEVCTSPFCRVIMLKTCTDGQIDGGYFQSPLFTLQQGHQTKLSLLMVSRSFRNMGLVIWWTMVSNSDPGTFDDDGNCFTPGITWALTCNQDSKAVALTTELPQPVSGPVKKIDD